MKKLFYLLFIIVSLFGQKADPDSILSKVKEKIHTVTDYQVNAKITIDVNFLRVPETEAIIYFKQPDKMKMESTGFALMPKQGLNFSPATLLSEEYTAILAKEDVIEGNEVYLIKILPISDSSQIILSNLWIDKTKSVVYKIETTTKNSGTISLALSYSDQLRYALPSKVVISFKVEQMNLPPGMTGEFEPDQETQKDESMTGTVTVEYSNYKVNQGLSDDFFEEKLKDEKE